VTQVRDGETVQGGETVPGGETIPGGEAPVRTVRETLAHRFREVAPALAGYAAARGFGLLVLAVLAARADRSVPDLLDRNDGAWYLGIATGGYDTSITYDADGLVNTNIEFFPLFPWLIRAGSAVGVAPLYAGIAIAAVAGLAAAWGIYAVGAQLHSRQLGILLAVLWGAVPHAIVQNMVYAESLFTAVAAWAIWAALAHRWLTAGLLTAVAGLVRPTAVALVAAVGLACLVAVFQRRGGWRPWAAAALAPAGLLGYWAWCAAALGRIDAWFWMQNQGWNSGLDFGETIVRSGLSTVTEPQPLAVYMTMLVVGIAAGLLALLILDRRPLVVVAYGAAMLMLIAFQENYFWARGRLLLPAFVLLIPVAAALVGSSRSTRWVVLVSLAAVSAWYGCYLLLVWPQSP
jgi:hypothetical protein